MIKKRYIVYKIKFNGTKKAQAEYIKHHIKITKQYEMKEAALDRKKWLHLETAEETSKHYS